LHLPHAAPPHEVELAYNVDAEATDDAVDNDDLQETEGEASQLVPDFDQCNTVAHSLEPEDLVGYTLHIYCASSNQWRLGIVTHVRLVDSWLCVEYSTAAIAYHNFTDKGQTTWGVARMHPVIHATMNSHGRKSLHEVQNGGHPDDRVVNQAMRHGKTVVPGVLRRSEMECFGPGSWLSGDAVGLSMNALCVTDTCSALKQNFYSSLVQSSHLTSNHRGASYTQSMRRWFRNSSYMWTQHKLLVIVHVNCNNLSGPWEIQAPNHWLLAVIDLEDKIFRYHDPLGSAGRQTIYEDQKAQCIANLKMWIASEHDMPWVAAAQVEPEQSVPTQGNGFDCGVYTVLYALCEAASVPLSELPFGQQHCPLFREQLIAALVDDATQ